MLEKNEYTQNKYCIHHNEIVNAIKRQDKEVNKIRNDMTQVKILLLAIALLIFGGYL